jgi:hypothetical protein
LAGEIQAEYRTYLDARGQPGVGDRFYQAVINSAPKKIVRIDLPKRDDGEFTDLPQELIDWVSTLVIASLPRSRSADAPWW